jgi:hypothetical protein
VGVVVLVSECALRTRSQPETLRAPTPTRRRAQVIGLGSLLPFAKFAGEAWTVEVAMGQTREAWLSLRRQLLSSVRTFDGCPFCALACVTIDHVLQVSGSGEGCCAYSHHHHFPGGAPCDASLH